MVFDTMVIAYALLRVEEFCSEAAAALEMTSEVWAPDSCRAELTNVAWQWVVHHELAPDLAVAALWDADALVSEFGPGNILWERALELAVERRHPAYDTLFLALAEMRGCEVVTYDKLLIERFPELTITVPEYLSGSGVTTD